MIKREFKVSFKSFVIWLSILVGLFGLVFLIYPFMFNDGTLKEIDVMLEMFPPELLKAFNMDLASMSTAYGWIKTEGFMFVLLVFGFYSSYLGGSILLKEENDKTIEYLSSLPVKRSKIVTDKIIVGITYIVAMVLLFGVFNYVCLLLSGEFDKLQFLLLSLSPIFIALPLFAINLFISTFMHKTKANVGISLGMVFIFYMLNVLSEISDKVDFLRYFSIYTLADVRKIIADVTINPIMVIISLVITIVFIGLSYIRYNKKELV